MQYSPTRGRYKVYLIDEVHMLSSHSFNAALKTLEEPPPHVKFLLATTDPQKLPVTILSRCLQFSLKNMPPERVVEHLTHVLGAENVPFEDDALWLLGRAADGSMRDAMSLTDQAIAFGEGKVLAADVRAMLGTLDHGQVYGVLRPCWRAMRAPCSKRCATWPSRGRTGAACLPKYSTCCTASRSPRPCRKRSTMARATASGCWPWPRRCRRKTYSSITRWA